MRVTAHGRPPLERARPPPAALGVPARRRTARRRPRELTETRSERRPGRRARCRAAALGALAACAVAPRTVGARPWLGGCRPTPTPRFGGGPPRPRPRSARRYRSSRSLALLADDDTWVAEAAAFALGERPDAATASLRRARRRPRPSTTTRSCAKPRSPRSARSAIPTGLPAVLAGCDDKPAIRRRAVLALAAFEGDEVEAALARARSTTATGRSARPPRTCSRRRRSPSASQPRCVGARHEHAP